jgi:predicted small secreted protein
LKSGFVTSNSESAVRRAFGGENVVTMKNPRALPYGILLLGGVGATLTGCNTSEGVGEVSKKEAREAK